MKKINITLIAVVLLQLIALPVHAKSPKITGYRTGTVTVDKSYSYRTVILDETLNPAKVHKSRVIELNYRVHLGYIFKWEMSLLMGEPVVVGWLAYKPSYVLPNNTTLFTEMGLNKEKILKKVRVSEFKMQVWFFKDDKFHGAARKFDTGVAWKPFLGYSIDDLMGDEGLYKKFRSYNVPGSPDWADLFYNIKDAQQAKKFFTDFTADERHITVSPSDFTIVKIDIDTSEIDKYIYEYLQGIENKIVKEKTIPLIAEKNRLESKVAKREHEEKTRAEMLKKEAKARYVEKSFDEQMDDLLGELEADEVGSVTVVNETSNEDDARIIVLENEIRETTAPLGRYVDENLERLFSNFTTRKTEVANLPSAMGKGEIEIFGHAQRRGARYKGTDIVIIEPIYEEICCGENRCLRGKDSYTAGSIGSIYFPVVDLVNFDNEVITQYKKIYTGLDCFKHYAHIKTSGTYSDKIISLDTGETVKSFHFKDSIEQMFVKNNMACVNINSWGISFLYDMENNIIKWSFDEDIKCKSWFNDHLLYVYYNDYGSKKGYIFDALKQEKVSKSYYDNCKLLDGEIYCKKSKDFGDPYPEYFRLNNELEEFKVDKSQVPDDYGLMY